MRIGETATRWEYLLLLIGAFAVPVVLVFGGYAPNWIMFSLGSVPMAFALARFILVESGRKLNNALAGTGQLTLLYGLSFGLGLVVARFL